MRRSLWAVGFVAAAAGCAGAPSEAPKANTANATETAPTSRAMANVYTLSVPNMT